ncbi:hypothetical protein RCL1_006558 [Eukaryota sp. TZLM3-RCL]
MKLHELESSLQQVQDFISPKITLEQYITPPHIAARMLHVAELSYGDIIDKNILDLGMGTGMLSIGAAILGANTINSIEIDPDAIAIAEQNLSTLEIDNITIHNADVASINTDNFPNINTVLLNPPFGTKNNAGIDILFLTKAIEISKGSVYSLHKSSTINHVVRVAKKYHVTVDVIATLHYDLPKTMKFHKKNVETVSVDIVRIQKR